MVARRDKRMNVKQGRVSKGQRGMIFKKEVLNDGERRGERRMKVSRLSKIG